MFVCDLKELQDKMKLKALKTDYILYFHVLLVGGIWGIM
jgi:hypothetical protein